MAVKDENEWFLQAEYDFETAEVNFNAGRHIFAVFMCHLAIEKAMKGVYYRQFQKDPPRTHSLAYLMEAGQIQAPESLAPFILKLSAISVPTRYPDQLREMQKVYDEERTQEYIQKSKEVLQWLKVK
jgi:HEPN domain-containing protein